MEDIEKKEHFVCDCGAHVLQTICLLEFHDNDKRYRQEWDFAMFDYSALGKPSFWTRLRVAWQYLKTGKMHDDQIILGPDEAEKLADFIKKNNKGKCINKKPQ